MSRSARHLTHEKRTPRIDHWPPQNNASRAFIVEITVQSSQFRSTFPWRFQKIGIGSGKVGQPTTQSPGRIDQSKKWRRRQDWRRTFSTFASRSRLAEGGLEVIGEGLHEVVLSQTLLVDGRRLRGRPSSRPDSARLPSSPLQLPNGRRSAASTDQCRILRQNPSP